MQGTPGLESAGIALIGAPHNTAYCDHCGDHEVDLLLNRSSVFFFRPFSCPEIGHQLERDAELRASFIPNLPLLERC
jgi:hypothetical protein